MTLIPSEKIIVALDQSDTSKAMTLLEELKGSGVWIKIGIEAFYSMGVTIVTSVSERGFKIFLDLKLHDIPTTVERSLESLLKLPINMINLHAAGGSEMIKKASSVIHNSIHSPLLIAVTQLTTTTQELMNSEQKIPGSLLDQVLHYAKLSQENGCHGVVCSPHEVKAIKKLCGENFLTVTPGVRLSHQVTSGETQDQKRVMTPLQAHLEGSDFLVIGRPLTQSPNPRKTLDEIISGVHS